MNQICLGADPFIEINEDIEVNMPENIPLNNASGLRFSSSSINDHRDPSVQCTDFGQNNVSEININGIQDIERITGGIINVPGNIAGSASSMGLSPNGEGCILNSALSSVQDSANNMIAVDSITVQAVATMDGSLVQNNVSGKKRIFMTPSLKLEIASMIRKKGIKHVLTEYRDKAKRQPSYKTIMEINKEQKKYETLQDYHTSLEKRRHNRGRKSIMKREFLDFTSEYFRKNPTKTIKNCVLALKEAFPNEKIPARTTLNEAILCDRSRDYGERFYKNQ